MSERPSILVAEPVRRGPTHQAFNASLILACHAALPEHQIVVLAFDDHLNALREVLGAPDWLVLEQFPPAFDSGCQTFVSAMHVASTVYQSAVSRQADSLILTSVTNKLLWAYRLLGLLKKRPRNVIAVFHAGLASIVRKRLFGRLRKFFSGRSAIMLSEKNMRFIVLERAIHKELFRRDARLAQRFSVLPHPLPPDLLNQSTRNQDSVVSPIRLGLLGLATPQKGLLQFLALAKAAKSQFPGEFDFQLVGRLHTDYQYLAGEIEEATDRKVPEEVLSRGDFVARLRELDFALFLFQGVYYELTASGVLVDCIALNLPVISTENGLVDEMESEVGPIGVRLKNESMECLSSELMQCLSESSYFEMTENLRRLSENRTPDALAPALRKLLM
jgi:hypothetical protein